jgi:signal transduction histidine kinase
MTDKSSVAGSGSVEEQLRASRVRILARADADRRDIERALHDGVQQDLVGLAVKLQLVRRLPDSEPAATQQTLDEIADDVREALARVQALSERIYPSVLDARGLAEALRGAAAATGARIKAEKLGRYSPQFERTVYFCCRETLERVAAHNDRLTLCLWEEQNALRFEVTLDGGLSDVARHDFADAEDRIDTLGGELTIGRASVSATIPVS